MPMRVRRLAPGLVALLAYRRADLVPDLIAGVSVAAVALPVGIAYAEIAGVPPVVGLYAAIFPLFAYALLGSSRQLITGPDAATCIMAATAVGAIAGGDPGRYAALMVALTLLTGLFYLLAGAARLGFIANFLSRPILTGYLNGIALLIIVGQLPKLCGLAGGGGDSFAAKLTSLFDHVDQVHPPSLILGAGLLILLLALRRWLPRLPAPLIVAVLGIVAVAAFGLADRGVAVLGPVPAGLPAPRLPAIAPADLRPLLWDAAGITLISFTSGVLTAQSFARRNRYDIDANQELIAFGAANLAAGLAQGFPVTGADSRTAVNDATGGRTQLVGIVAGLTMLIFLQFLTQPLRLLPTAALAAIIIVSAFGWFDAAALRQLWRASGRELLLSVATTAGVLFLGVLPGVLLAVVLSLLWLLAVGSRPHDAILGRAAGVKGFHDIADYAGARTVPGLLLYRFDADLVFFNSDYFKARILHHVDAAATPIEWVVVDASPVNIVDYTAVKMLDELRAELEGRGIVLASARAKQSLQRYFKPHWVHERGQESNHPSFPTIKAAIDAFEHRPRSEDTPEAPGRGQPLIRP